MRTRLLALIAALCASAAFAQDAVRLNSPLPEPGQAVVQTQLKKPGEAAALRPEPAPATPAAGDARPMIPAATPSGATSQVPPPATTTLPPAPASGPGPALVPGQPAKVYTTLEQAKADGIDPLGEMKALAPPPAPEAPAVGFDWRAPASWPAWARENPKEAALYGGGAFAALVLLMLALGRRSSSQA